MSTYAVADLHGMYGLFSQIKNFIKPDDTVYVIGDCADRGPDGWKIINEVYDNPQFIYIKGNHEDMLVEAMYSDTINCFYNGGEVTYEAWIKDGSNPLWIKKLSDLPCEKTYINKKNQKIILVHAGYTPHVDNNVPEMDKLWSRDHFEAEWDEYLPYVFIIHGHTPIPHMGSYLWDIPDENFSKPGALWYCPDINGINHKCDIDAGAYFTGNTVLLDLDTFEEHIFSIEK